MSLKDKIEALAHKLELDAESVLAHLHKEIDNLLGLAEDNVELAKQVVKASATEEVNSLSADADKEINKV